MSKLHRAKVTVLASEINVVKARRLWPPTLVQPPLNDADRRVLSSLALEGKRRPEQFASASFDEQRNSADQHDAATTETSAPEPATRC